MPGLAKLAPKITGWQKIVDLLNEIRGVTIENVEEHKRSYSEDENPRDFIDAYLKEIKATTDPKSSFYKDAGGQTQILKMKIHV